MVALIIQLSPLAIVMKRKGERGYPFQMLQEGVKGWDGTPLMRIEKKEEEVRLRIQST
jgi:hypothetical protein